MAVGSCIRPLRLLSTLLSGLPLAATYSPTSLFAAWSSAVHILEHATLQKPKLNERQLSLLDDLTNTRIPGPPGSGIEIRAFTATPPGGAGDKKKSLPAIILLHEFFGLNPSIVGKAQGLEEELGCVVVAPDTFRGVVTDFIPKAIWLALTTPQERVNDDLDAVFRYLEESGEVGERKLGLDKVAIMGFCYGGGKAIRYTTQRRPDAATVVFYGSPVVDVSELGKLNAPVCGIFGDKDAQFPLSLLRQFESALDDAGVENEVRVYEGVGHAFWKDMEQVRTGEEPQREAFQQAVCFLRSFFFGGGEQR